jgi:hypothetical protein
MSTQKILIDYSEFKRLKEVEKKYHEHHSQSIGEVSLNGMSNMCNQCFFRVKFGQVFLQEFFYDYILIKAIFSDTSSNSNTQTGQGLSALPSSSSGKLSLTSIDQLGTGASLLENSDFVGRIADLVSKRISQPAATFKPVNNNWRFYEKSEPTVTSEVRPGNTTPPINYSNVIRQNDLNDSFDENALLKKVPKPYKKKASLLLRIFDERPNELTWDSAGNIYADEQAIPNANIFELFPYLFRKRAPKTLTGLPDLIEKLQGMGLGHLINCPSVQPKKVSKTTPQPIPQPSTSGDWWFLGP